jgi:hypothetical protein
LMRLFEPPEGGQRVCGVRLSFCLIFSSLNQER